eukprot:365761-Chlamydomonas_euryale.AAC.8
MPPPSHVPPSSSPSLRSSCRQRLPSPPCLPHTFSFSYSSPVQPTPALSASSTTPEATAAAAAAAAPAAAEPP